MRPRCATRRGRWPRSWTGRRRRLHRAAVDRPAQLGCAPVRRAEPGRLRRRHRHRARRARAGAVLLGKAPLHGRVIERMRALHPSSRGDPALRRRPAARHPAGPFRMRLAGEVDHSIRPVVARMVATTLDDALRPTARPRARARPVVAALPRHRGRRGPGARRRGVPRGRTGSPWTGVRPGVLRALDRCGAPFAAQLDVSAHPVSRKASGARVRPAPAVPGYRPRRQGHGRDEGRDHPHGRDRPVTPRGRVHRLGGRRRRPRHTVRRRRPRPPRVGRAGGAPRDRAGAAADRAAGRRGCPARREAATPRRSCSPSPSARTTGRRWPPGGRATCGRSPAGMAGSP